MLKSAFVWTDDARAEAIEMWNDGRSQSEIAEFFTISIGAVSGYISRNRDAFAKRSSSEILEAKIQRAISRPKKDIVKVKWTDERVEKASAMWAGGHVAAEIAEAIGCSPTALYEFTSNNRDKFPKRLKASTTPKPKRVPVEPVTQARDPFDFSGYRLPGIQPISFIAIGHGQCRFPLDKGSVLTGPSMACCGAESGPLVYCPAHMSIARGRGTESERTAHKVSRRVGG